MKILALEMSTARGSIAVEDDGEVRFDCHFAADRKHSGAFFENLEQCLRRFGDPEQIVVGLGPGSYAGVRIAIASALGLRSATAARLAGVPSICTLDVEVDEYGVIGDARRQSFFFARVKDARLIEGPILESAPELDTRLKESALVIYASEPLPQFPLATLAYPDARRLARFAREHADEIHDVQVLEPIYLREPHITVPRVQPVTVPTR